MQSTENTPDSRTIIDDLVRRLHREVRTDTEWLRLVADALAAERDRADRAEARLAKVVATVNKFAGRKYDANVPPHGAPEYWRGAEHAQDYIFHRVRTALADAEATA